MPPSGSGHTREARRPLWQPSWHADALSGKARQSSLLIHSGRLQPDPKVAIGGLDGDGRLPVRVLEVEEEPAVLEAIQETEWRLRARESPEVEQRWSWSRLKP